MVLGRKGQQGKRSDRGGAHIPLPNLDTIESHLPLAFQGSSDVDYDPHAFYTRATNAHDHSSEIRTRVHADLIGLVDRIIASGKLAHTPIKTRGDFLRDAMVHRVWRVSEMLADPLFIALSEKQIIRDRIQEIVDDMTINAELVEQTEASLTRAQTANDEIAVRMVVIQAEMTLNSLRDPYLRQVEEVITEGRRWLGRVAELNAE